MALSVTALEKRIARLQAQLDAAKAELAKMKSGASNQKRFEIVYTRHWYEGTKPGIFTESFEAKTADEAVEKLLAEMERKSRRMGRMPLWEVLSVVEKI